MSRIKLEMPKKYLFTSTIDVRITDLNYGNHLGNDALISILQEARVRFLNNYGYKELNIEGVGIMMADLVVIYKSQSYYGDSLYIEIGIGNISKKSCDIFYRVTKNNDTLVALCKTTVVFFNYQTQKPVRIPEQFVVQILGHKNELERKA